MPIAVLDAGVAIGWIQGRARSKAKIASLFAAGRARRLDLVMSTVNLAETLKHTADLSQETGVDPVVLLAGQGVRFHEPGEAVARRVAKLRTSIADGFATATAQELRARLHTTDAELAEQLTRTRVRVTMY